MCSLGVIVTVTAGVCLDVVGHGKDSDCDFASAASPSYDGFAGVGERAGIPSCMEDWRQVVMMTFQKPLSVTTASPGGLSSVLCICRKGTDVVVVDFPSCFVLFIYPSRKIWVTLPWVRRGKFGSPYLG